MKKILFISLRSFENSSSAMIRNKSMIIGFLKNGFSVDVLSTHKIVDASWYNNFGNIKWYFLDDSYCQTSNTSKTNGKFKAFLYKIKKRLILYDSSKKYVDSEININYDLYDYIVSSSDPKSSHLFVYKNRKKIKNLEEKWIQIWGDPFASDITEMHFIPILKKIEEKKLLRYSYKVFYVSPFTLEKQKKLYYKYANKMEYTLIPFLKEKKYDLSNINTKLLLYAGDYYKDVRNILPIIEAIKNTDFKLKIFGDSDMNIKSYLNVQRYSRQPSNIIEKAENEAGIFIFIANKRGDQIPGKIYQMMGTNKPILFIKDGNEEI